MPEGTLDYKTEVLDYLTKNVGKSTVKPTKPLTLDSLLKDDWGFDSLDGVETWQDIEKEYERVIPEEVAESWKTGRDIATYLENPDAYVASKNIILKPKQP